MLSGCSFAIVSGPSAVSPDGRGELACTTSHVGPIVDAILTLAQVVDIALTASQSRTDWNGHFCAAGDPSCSAPLSRGEAIGVYSALGLASAASAVYGLSRIVQCRDARASVAGGAAGELGSQHVAP